MAARIVEKGVVHSEDTPGGTAVLRTEGSDGPNENSVLMDAVDTISCLQAAFVKSHLTGCQTKSDNVVESGSQAERWGCSPDFLFTL